MKKRFLFAGTAVFVLLTFFCALLLIPYIGDAILPPLLQKLPFEEKNIQLSRVTPWKIVGHFNITDKKSKFSSARFEIHYSPTKLYKGKVDTIVLDGALIELAPELFTSEGKSQTKASGNSNFFQELPIVVEKIILKDVTVITRLKDNLAQTFHIAGVINLLTKQQGKGYSLEQIHTKLTTKGSLHSKLVSRLDIKNNNLLLTSAISIKKIDLPRSLNFPPFSGTIHASSTVTLDRMFKEILHIEAHVASQDIRLNLDKILVTAQQSPSLQVNINGTPQKLSFDFKGIAMSTPNTTIQTSGNGEFYPKSLDLNSQATFTLAEFGEPVTVTAMKNGDTFNVELSAENLQLKNTELKHSPLQLSLSGTIIEDQIQAKLQATMKSLELPKQEIKVSAIQIIQPLHIKNKQLQTTTGTFTIKDIFYKTEKVATISGKTSVSNLVQAFTAQIKSPLHTEMAINCDGNYQTSQDSIFSANCNLNDIIISQNTLPRFINIPEDLTFNAKLGADLNFTFINSIQGTLRARIEDTTINSGDKISLTGLSTDITLPYLPLQQSLPSQNLQIDEINVGTIQLTDTDIAYRLENFKTLFVEHSRFNWCGGKVESGAIRIASDKDEYGLTLYCDRIGFTELLGQLGMPNAEGEGTLNGRLPISLTGTTPHFDDGFLFSSPGDSGIVRFTNTEAMRDNLGADVGTSYLDYSMSSLENFKYNWATLSFNSIKDNLTISMQLDGKPAAPLPFKYKNGQLVPSDAGMGIQHPIHLDVNFHLPLTDLLYYGRNIQSLMETM